MLFTFMKLGALGAAGVALLSGSLAFGAPQAEKAKSGKVPRKLDEAIEMAIRNNPNIRLVTAQLREAEAKLNQVRLEVAREVVEIFNERKVRQNDVRSAHERVEESQVRHKNGLCSRAELQIEIAKLARAEVSLSQIHSQLRYVVGIDAERYGARPSVRQDSGSAPMRRTLRPRRPTPPADTEARLEGSVGGARMSGTVVALVKSFAAGKEKGLNFVIDPEVEESDLKELHVDLSRPLPLRAALGMLHDLEPEIVFLLKDYGVFVTTAERAQVTWCAAIPANFPAAREVWPGR